MIIDFSTEQKTEKTKKELLNINRISDDDIFILQHITVNNDECKYIKKYGILNKKELFKHDEIECVQKLKEISKRAKIQLNTDYNTNVCAFLCANMNLDYDNNLAGLPEILNSKSRMYLGDKYIITFKVKYMNIEKSGFFGPKIYNENIIERLKNISDEGLKEVVNLSKDYNVPVENIINIEEI